MSYFKLSFSFSLNVNENNHIEKNLINEYLNEVTPSIKPILYSKTPYLDTLLNISSNKKIEYVTLKNIIKLQSICNEFITSNHKHFEQNCSKSFKNTKTLSKDELVKSIYTSLIKLYGSNIFSNRKLLLTKNYKKSDDQKVIKLENLYCTSKTYKIINNSFDCESVYHMIKTHKAISDSCEFLLQSIHIRLTTADLEAIIKVLIELINYSSINYSSTSFIKAIKLLDIVLADPKKELTNTHILNMLI